ncbi:MAG TPA: DNA polymerase IV [Actinomycetota bacterium]|nr:DNA polymerase IV [Actinomycetota bacterium]
MTARWVLHMDLDEFIAAVEVLRRPELAGRPVVVGGDGDPTKRGVVSTANYEARTYGVHSGMPLRSALKRCPEAVFLPVDAPAYLTASSEVMDTLRTFPAVVQVLGWDEAFLGVRTDDPEALARDVQRAVFDRTRLWCSIGVGDTTLRAKLASGFAKPRGVFRLTEGNWMEVMGALPTEDLFGIGRKTAAKLEALGIRTVEELANAEEDRLAGRFGPRTGPWLSAVARGDGEHVVTDEPYVPRGHGKERTFQRDLTDPGQIRIRTAELARELAAELARGDRPAVRVVVKVRFAPFFTSTHGVRLPVATLEAAAIERGALDALGRFELDRPVRLLGVRAELADPEPG